MDAWKRICLLDDIPRLGSRVVRSAAGSIAVFRSADDALFALQDQCPHRGGPLSQGIVTDKVVICPLHGLKLGLEDGGAVAPDKGCARRFPVKLEGNAVWLQIE